MNKSLFPWVHVLDRRRETGRGEQLEKAHAGRWPLGCPYHLCGYGACLVPGGSGTWFFIRIRTCLISACHWRHFLSLGTWKLRGGRAALPDREVESAVWPTHQQQCLLRNETQQQRQEEETAVKGRRTVRDPKIGKSIILSMTAKNWIPGKAQLYSVMLILGNKR